MAYTKQKKISDRRRATLTGCATVLASLGGALAFGALAATPAAASATCPIAGPPPLGGAEPPMAVDGDCVDPDYNATTFVTDSVTQQSVKLADGTTVPYTEVKGHFPATRTSAQLPAGIKASPTTAAHAVTWRFPAKSYWHHRFFQQSYPLAIDYLNTVDSAFAFTNGAFTVGIKPGNPSVGYRVSAAAAKLAKVYASRLYGDTGRIFGYIYGQSGGSVQMMGANEGTTGVWDGIIPVVIAVDGLNTHSFQWNALYALAVPETKRLAVAQAAAPGSGRDIHDGLTAEEGAILDELLRAGFSRKALEEWKFSVGSALPLSGAVAALDPGYEDDFWSKPGYEGANPPAYLAAAKVDGFARITTVNRNADKQITGIVFDQATVPAMGSTGAEGLQFYVYASDGVSRIVSGNARQISGKLEGNVLSLSGTNNPALLEAVKPGAKIRINNRFMLAACFYPRHSILDNGSQAYAQYRNADGSPKYAQRPIQAAYAANVGSAGGRRETGHLKVRTMVLENLADPASYPYVGGFYAEQVHRAMGAAADGMFRVYYQDNAQHGAFPTNGPEPAPAKLQISVASVGGVLNQALLDMAAWVEHGVTPVASTRYATDAMTQIVLPAAARERRGYQPVVDLTANGGVRVVTGVNQPVTLSGRITMPPGVGKITDYDWYVGSPDFKFEPLVQLAAPKASVELTRTVRFAHPGEYTVTLRTHGGRSVTARPDSGILLENLARVRIVVK